MESDGVSRDKILGLTARLLTEIHPGEINLDTIAEKTGMEKSSMLMYFENKEDLLLSVVERKVEKFWETFTGKYESLRAVEVLEIFLKDYEKFIRENPTVKYIILSSVLHHRNESKVRERLQVFYKSLRGMLSRNLRLANNEMGKHFAGIIVAVMDGFYMQWTLEPEEIDLRKSIEVVKSLIVHYYGNKMG